MARLKIKDAPLLTSIIGDEKIPTGGKGDFTLTPSMLLSFVESRLPFATNAQLESVRQTLDTKIGTVKTELETSIDSLDVRVTNNETSVLGVVQDLTLHKADKSNPHAVTKQQVGLGNVDNTSDINKPVSTATQNSLNLKFDKQEAQDKIYKNGAALPYDSSIAYNEGAVVVKDGELQQKSGADWKPFNKNVKTSDVVDDSGKTQEEINKGIKASPRMFGYRGGDNFSECLQLAIDSGLDVIGSNKSENVKMLKPVFISKNNQNIDLSMLTVDWSATEKVFDLVSDRSIGVLNIRPKTADREYYQNNFKQTFEVLTLPLQDDNKIFVNTTSMGLSVGDLVLLKMSYPTGTTTPYRACTVVAVSDSVLEIDYRFSYVPNTLEIITLKDWVSDVVLSMPKSITDNSNASSAVFMISGCGVSFAKNCEINAGDLKNGAYPTINYRFASKCKDFNASNTKPRLVGGGQGYTIQANYSTFIESHSPKNINGRHVVDYTCSAFCKNYNAEAYDMQQVPYTCHGLYEHDCDFINPFSDDCSHLTSALGRAVSIANSGAEFGFAAKNINIVGGVLKGAIGHNPNCISCNVIEGAIIDTTSVTTLSPLGNISVDFIAKNTGTVFFQSDTGTGNVYMNGGYIRSPDLRHGVDKFIASGNSEVFNLATTSTTGKPNNIIFTDTSIFTVNWSPTITANKSIEFGGSSVMNGSPTTKPTLSAKNIIIGDEVSFLNSSGMTSLATDTFYFAAKCIEAQTGRTAPMISHSQSNAKVVVNSATFNVQATTIQCFSISSAATGIQLVMMGNIINGQTNIASLTNLSKCLVVNNIVNDDAALRGKTTSGSLVFQNNI